MLSFNSILFILVSITTHINGQTVSCSGNCGCPTAPTGTTCILDCGGGQDNCKGKTLTCRANDPCTILCDAKATCSDGTTINAATATYVTVLCNGDDACKTKIDISCGTGHCELQCTGSFSTACQDFGGIDTTNADSFDCIGDCPASIPASFSGAPTSSPTNIPSATPTIPSTSPTPAPTANPTPAPTLAPTSSPTPAPTYNPTLTPSVAPTSPPTNAPTLTPTNSPSNAPTHPTATPTNMPTSQPTIDPTYDPTIDPTVDPTVDPTTDPTSDPTNNPTMAPTNAPSANPTTAPSVAPSMPSLNPSSNPTSAPTIHPTNYPTSQPTVHPTSVPTFHPTFNPTLNPTFDPSTNPTSDPTYNPTASPSNPPSDSPTNNPTAAPTNNPSKSPSYEPTIRPSPSPTVPTTIHTTDSDDTSVNASAELQTNGNTAHTIDGVTVTVMVIACLIGLCCVALCVLRNKQLKNKRNKQLFGEEEMPSKSNISSQISTWRSKSASSASTNHTCASPQSAARSNAQLKSVKEEKQNCHHDEKENDDWEFEVEICTPKGAEMSHNYVTQLMLQNTMNNATHSNNSGHSARTEPLKNNNIQPTEIRRALSQNNYAYPYAHNYMPYHPMTPGQYQFSPSTMPLTPPYGYQMAAQSQSQRNMVANANTMQAYFVPVMQLPSQHSLHHSHGSQHTGNNQQNVTVPGLPPPQLSDVCSAAVGAELSDISSSEDGDEDESESESIRTSESDSSEMTGNNEDTVVEKLLIQNEV